MKFPDYLKTTTRLTATMPIDNVGSGILTALASLKIKVRAGDIIRFTASVQFTLPTPLSYNVNCPIQLNLGSTSADLTGSVIRRPKGENFNAAIHHKERQIAYDHQFTSDFNGFIVLCGFSASTAASSGDLMTVENNIEFTATIERKPKLGMRLKLA